MTTTTHHTRHPAQPLLDHLHLHTHQPSHLAQALNISVRQAHRIIHHGLSDTQADRHATQLGLHPTHLWPNWYDIDPDTEEDPHGTMRVRPP